MFLVKTPSFSSSLPGTTGFLLLLRISRVTHTRTYLDVCVSVCGKGEEGNCREQASSIHRRVLYRWEKKKKRGEILLYPLPSRPPPFSQFILAPKGGKEEREKRRG